MKNQQISEAIFSPNQLLPKRHQAFKKDFANLIQTINDLPVKIFTFKEFKEI